ncbi:hypothetical protein CSA56_11955 [candidate division KSB3 bacterium]|uniref:V-type proton ATPase subunit E n=1 Tax=candidate division KSB3 bacterium TaxID=2044937 RepID=A0A2G6KCK1_9BACT|nr:MAG: hypothetical protein CSA56_11955 [candidate division KSB3 bacterium]
MPVETETDFSQAILNEARQEAEGIVDLARREAERILEEARKELEQAYRTESPTAAAQMAKTRFKQLVAAAKLDARKQHLLTQERLIADVWQNVSDQLLLAREDEAYPKLLQRLTHEGIDALDGEQFELIVAQEDRHFITQDFLQALSEQTGTTLALADQSEPDITGVIVQRADKRVRCDNSLQGILLRQEDTLRLEIAKRLFEADGVT